MQVHVKTIGMNKIPDDMSLIQKKINACILELEQVRRDLDTLSGLDEPVREIRKCEKKLEAQARYCMLFGNTMSQICRQYEGTEKNIVDYSEDVRRKAQREALRNRNLKDLYPLFYSMIF